MARAPHCWPPHTFRRRPQQAPLTTAVTPPQPPPPCPPPARSPPFPPLAASTPAHRPRPRTAGCRLVFGSAFLSCVFPVSLTVTRLLPSCRHSHVSLCCLQSRTRTGFKVHQFPEPGMATLWERMVAAVSYHCRIFPAYYEALDLRKGSFGREKAGFCVLCTW